jgi:hypothetical protein
MPLSSEFSVDGNSAVEAIEVAYGATVALAALSTEFRTIEWVVVSTSKADLVAPTITKSGAPTGVTASFTWIANPGDGLGRAIAVACVQTDSQGQTAIAYRIIGTANGQGEVPFVAAEELWRHSTHGWTEMLNRLLSAAGGAGVTDHGALTGLTDVTDHLWAELAARPLVAYAGAASTPVLADARKHITTSHGSANTLTIPPAASVAYDAATLLMGTNIGAGTMTLTAGAGVTVNGSVTVAAHGWWWAKKTNTNTWQTFVGGSSGGTVTAGNGLTDTAGTFSVDAEDATIVVGAGGIKRAPIGGDVVIADGSNTAAIPSDTITYAKIQNVSAASRVIGRGSAAGAGDAEELTPTGGIEVSGTNLQRSALSGDITAAAGSGTTAITANVIVDADVNTAAAIAGTKISPNFGAQNVVTTGTLGSGKATIAPAVEATGSPRALQITAAAHTTLTASAEVIDVDIALNRTVQRATGAVTTQRAMLVRAPTYSFVAASVVAAAASFAIEGAPVAGTNATLTESYALWVQAGAVRLGALGAGFVKSSATGVLSVGTVATSDIADGSITYAKIQDVSAASRLLGRGSAAGAGDVQELTVGGGIEFSGTAIQCSAISGDITIAAGSTTAAITAGVIVNADINSAAAIALSKLQNVATAVLLGRVSVGTGGIETLDVTGGVEFTASGIQRSALTGDVTASAGSNTTAIAAGVIVDADINASAAIAHTKLATIATDRLMGRDTAGTGTIEPIALGASLEFSGSATIQRAALTGDITAAANSNTTAIAAGVIVDADVNASAAIAGSKISPNFVAQNITTTGDILLGTTPATVGDFRVNHGFTLNGRDNGNANDRSGVRWGAVSTDTWTFGDAAVSASLVGSAIQIGDSTEMIEVASLATNREVISLLLGASLTTTHMPANTGDKVIYLAAATAAPTAAPVGGCIMYATSSGELVTVSTDGATLNMKLGDGSNGVEIKAGGATDSRVKLISGLYKSSFDTGFLDFDADSTGAATEWNLKYRGNTYLTMGRSGGVKLSFFGATASAQAADPVALTHTPGSAADNTVADVGAAFSQATLNQNFADLVAKYNTLRTILRNYGLAA